MATGISTEASPAVENEVPKTAEGLRELTTNANLQYSLKNYDAASEMYSQAAELQDELNGELAPENAEVLYLYGRCLFKVALAKSDLLGGQLVGDGGKGAAMEKQLKATEEEDAKAAARNAILMQITGDDEEEEDDQEEQGDEDGEADEEEDEFRTAHDILDLSRVLYERQPKMSKSISKDESADGEKGKSQASSKTSSESKHVTERLADIHDLLAEIALENEDFAQAASESKDTLKLRQDIYSLDSGLIAEGHYKLALALEFAFQKAVNDAKTAEEEGKPSKDAKDAIDVKMLYEAVTNLALAIKSCESRIAAEEKKVDTLSADAAATLKRDIQDVKEMVQELKVKLADVGNTAKSVTPNKDLTPHLDPAVLQELEKTSGLLPAADPEAVSALEQQEAVTGTAAIQPGESAKERQQRIDEATAKATDLSGLIRHKKKAADPGAAAVAGSVASETNGKRKLDDDDEPLSSGEGKKVKFAGEETA